MCNDADARLFVFVRAPNGAGFSLGLNEDGTVNACPAVESEIKARMPYLMCERETWNGASATDVASACQERGWQSWTGDQSSADGNASAEN